MGGDKNKNPTAGRQWGSGNFRMQSEPGCHATQQQRVQQQIQVQIAIHANNVTIATGRVKWFLAAPVNDYLFASRPKIPDKRARPNGRKVETMKIFEEAADPALQAMRLRAEQLKIKGVAMVAASAGDRVQSWSSKMLVVGAMKKGPSPEEPEMNLLAIVYSKAAEMADTLKASGSGVRAPLMGEYGWGGGVVAKGKTGYLFAAFSGGSSADDVKAAQAGLDILVKAMG